MRYVIVGNSIAGIEAAIALRNRDATAEIVVVSAEHDHPFARVSLMYLFAGQLSLRDTEFHDRDLYARMRFTRVRDRVTAVDSAQKQLQLAQGPPLAYDKLLLAVGSVARRLPTPGAYEGPGVHHFVTLSDLEALDRAARPGMAVAVIGGGLIGVEVAEVLHARGLRTHFLIREPWYFPVALDLAEAELVAEHLRRHGVDCRTGTSVQAIRRADRLRLDLGGEELAVDLVVATVGVVPATDFLRGGGVALADNGAIETGDSLQSTSAPDVWAAGDCANVRWPDGSRRPEQLWYTARDQGRAAARAMLGDEIVYRRGTWYNSAKFFDVEYTTAGFLPTRTPGPGWSSWFQRLPDRCVSQRIVCRDGVVVGFNALGSRWDHQRWMQWIHERRPLDWVLAHMDEARFDEEFMPRFRVLPTATVREGV